MKLFAWHTTFFVLCLETVLHNFPLYLYTLWCYLLGIAAPPLQYNFEHLFSAVGISL